MNNNNVLRKDRTRWGAIFLLSAASLLSACGGDDTGASSSSSGNASNSSSSSSSSSSSTSSSGTPVSTTITIEEQTTGACAFDGEIDTLHTGFNGEGFIDTPNATGSAISWQLASTSTQQVTLGFRYANGSSSGSRPGEVTVNGSGSTTATFAPTDTWTNWVEQTVTITLAKGTNSIKLTSTTDSGLANIDALTVTASGVSADDCPPEAATMATDKWFAVVHRESGLAFDVENMSTETLAPLIQGVRGDTENQLFRLISSGNNYYRLHAQHSNLVLDLLDFNTEDGATFIQYDDLMGENQQFQFLDLSNGYYQIINRTSGKALAPQNDSDSPGAPIAQYTPDFRNQSQHWQLVEVEDYETSSATIYNNTWWMDTTNNPIFSQGGSVLKVDDTYYWYGVEYRGAQLYYDNPAAGKRNNDVAFVSVNTYSSKDLVNWKLEAKDRLANPGGWFGRMGVAYNKNTRKYVLIAQTYGGGGAVNLGGKTSAHATYFATSDSPAGGFTFSNIQQPLEGVVNGATGDQTMFIDDDGKAYIVASSVEGRSNRYLIPLRESDYLRLERPIFVNKGSGREGNCMFKHEGTYYFCSSDLHGWNTSQTYCVTSQSVNGPWSSEFVMKGSERDYSHVTQAGFFIKVNGTEKTTIIYAGDRWADFAGNGIGYNQWVPISFNGKEPFFNSLSAWSINATTGNWTVAPENNYVLNPSFEADRVKVGTPRGWRSSGAYPSGERQGHTGKWSWDISGSGYMSHDIEKIPDGTYDLAVWVTGNGGELYVRNHGGSEMRMAIPSSSNWTRVRLSNIQVSSGVAEIGVRANGRNVRVDDFTMILSGYDVP